MRVVIAMPRMSTDPEPTVAQSKYIESLARAGAKMRWVELSDPEQAVQDALTCDGLLLPGGGDMDPKFYGEERIPACGEPNLLRDAAEPLLLRAFLAADKPVLGICRGIQVINVFFGGTLCQDLPGHSAVDGHDSFHTVRTARSPLLAVCGPLCRVNSAHHQAADAPGRGLRAVQWAEDGAVEAVCHDCLPVWGVQWHPERLPGELGGRLLRAFLALCF